MQPQVMCGRREGNKPHHTPHPLVATHPGSGRVCGPPRRLPHVQHRISSLPCGAVFNDNVSSVMERPRTRVVGCGRREWARM
ncbi:hypothetical protein E2C01_088459 [Portunus trituberculatus]|uniref:Uncharacterized protein n=1 Tax=Portunus trituberculatus TaxID=210409 RepID=A0A5B7JFG6_PORTR|nr:hypothetical protein [Portunus trituberculatus]